MACSLYGRTLVLLWWWFICYWWAILRYRVFVSSLIMWCILMGLLCLQNRWISTYVQSWKARSHTSWLWWQNTCRCYSIILFAVWCISLVSWININLILRMNALIWMWPDIWSRWLSVLVRWSDWLSCVFYFLSTRKGCKTMRWIVQGCCLGCWR